MGVCCVKSQGCDDCLRSQAIMHSTRIENVKKLYKFGKTIGHGSFGEVRTAVRKGCPRLTVAIKSISKEIIKGQINLLRTEVESLLTVDHPNIIRLYNVYEDGNSIHLILEYCKGGDLFTKITQQGHLSECEARRLMKKMLMSVAHLHSNNIVHRDLKPQHFLFENPDDLSELKLIDFGLSHKFVKYADQMHSSVGTLYYTAPEVLSGSYSNKCDLWSLGVILYAMLSGDLPFYGSISCIMKNINSGIFSMDGEIWSKVSQNAKDLIRGLICKDENQRLNAEDALKQPWFEMIPKESPKFDKCLLNSLKEYRKSNLFQKEAMNILAKHLPEKEIWTLKNAFLSLDAEGIGSIAAENLTRRLSSIENDLSKPEAAEITIAIDRRNSGRIFYSDFLAAALFTSKIYEEQFIEIAFKFFDTEQNGYLTRDNFEQTLMNLGKDINLDEHQELTKIFKNSNEKITFQEFRNMLLSPIYKE
ncbi:unnamed protein product [Blepharisma stoltei]|uniref:Calcium-dependent protein kinase n=1 Tax=Blepharisma stoltei TaxID=1481888 RepID=A0AAU9JLM3_9CILI|nr:unnamed protein product [Blepharisma stoltei]